LAEKAKKHTGDFSIELAIPPGAGCQARGLFGKNQKKDVPISCSRSVTTIFPQRPLLERSPAERDASTVGEPSEMKTFIGFEEARELTLAAVRSAGSERLPLAQAVGRFMARDLISRVDSPSLSTSRKDGYAVVSADLSTACPEKPVRLELVGRSTAGVCCDIDMRAGQAVQVTTGAPLPEAADAVIAEEFCRVSDRFIFCANTAEQGRNILYRGTDVRRNEPVGGRSAKITPALVGLLAAAGHTDVDVGRTPRITVIATGDEVALPGAPLKIGQLYASNMMETCAWLTSFGICWEAEIVPDSMVQIAEAVTRRLPQTDVYLTSGGAWGSRKDLMLRVLADLRWEGIYHRVKMGPGKPVGFGLLHERPFFVLPGGPPSNEMAFLQLALPAIAKMMGGSPKVFTEISARLTAPVSGQQDWTSFLHAHLAYSGHQALVTPSMPSSRLKSMAEKTAIAILPEGVAEIPAGAPIKTQVLPP